VLLVPASLAVPLANAFDPTVEDVPASAPLAPVGLQAPTNLQSPDAAGLNAQTAEAKATETAQATQPEFMSPYSAAAAQADPNAATAAPTATPTASPTATPTETPTPEAAPAETATPAPADDRAQPPIPEAIAQLDKPFELLTAAMVEAGFLPGRAPQDQAPQPEFMDPNSAAASAPTATPGDPDGDTGSATPRIDPWSFVLFGGSAKYLAEYHLGDGLTGGAEGRGSTRPTSQSPDAAESSANLSTPARRDLAEAKAVLAEAEADLADAQQEPAKADVGQASSNVELARQEYGEAQLDLAADEARRKLAALDPRGCGLDGARCNALADAAWPADKRIHRFRRQLERSLLVVEVVLKSLWNGEPGANQ
jgi:hypothetical protein